MDDVAVKTFDRAAVRAAAEKPQFVIIAHSCPMCGYGDRLTHFNSTCEIMNLNMYIFFLMSSLWDL